MLNMINEELYSGFYCSDLKLEDVKNQKYDLISNPNSDSADYLYDDATIFLHGSCNLFALALHERFNYTVYEIKDTKDREIHIFCKCEYFGKDAFIDIRGITTDFTEFVKEFPSYCREKGISIRNVDEDELLNNDGDETGMRFARDVIERYAAYYCIDKQKGNLKPECIGLQSKG